VHDRKKLFTLIEKSRKDMIELQRLLTSIPALAPESGGEGELAKAEALVRWLEKRGVPSVETYASPDARVPSGKRPSVIATLPGKRKDAAFWVMSHLDVVPPGDLTKWAGDPYTLVEKDGRLYGRGAEDNQQGLVSSVFALLALMESGLVPERTVKLLFAADEENGSEHGIQYLLREHGGLFGPEDLFLVPDGGRPDSTMIEIAEKSLLWMKFTTEGKQVHASMPHLGKNAFLAGSDLAVRLAVELKRSFPENDPIFDPPVSTFSPTKKEANVPNVNTIPGLDVFCLDSRILPSVKTDAVLDVVDRVMREIERDHGVKVTRETIQRSESPATRGDCGLVKSLSSAVKRVYGTEARAVGLGGGTVGAFLRKKGLDTVVWSTLDETAHQPNEYCVTDFMVKDAMVMLDLMLG